MSVYNSAVRLGRDFYRSFLLFVKAFVSVIAADGLDLIHADLLGAASVGFGVALLNILSASDRELKMLDEEDLRGITRSFPAPPGSPPLASRAEP